jgi:hypothetical protein
MFARCSTDITGYFGEDVLIDVLASAKTHKNL